MGIVFERQNKKEEAFEYYQKAVKIVPEYLVFNKMGNIKYQQLQFQEAIAYYERAIELGPQDEQSYNNMGNILSDIK